MNKEVELIPIGTKFKFMDTRLGQVFKGRVSEDNGDATVCVDCDVGGNEFHTWMLRERVLSFLDDKKPLTERDVDVDSELKNDPKDESYDFINPSHYQNSGGKETIEMMLDIWGVESVIAHCQMCAFKYRMRLGKKPKQPIERDLEKAQWYENKANELLEL